MTEQIRESKIISTSPGIGDRVSFDVDGDIIVGRVKEIYSASRQHPNGAVVIEDGAYIYVMDVSGHEDWCKICRD